jgi:hypothetical protein
VTGSHVHDQFARAGQRRLRVVRHGQRLRARLAGDAHHLDQVGRATALADSDDERVAQVGPGTEHRDGGRARQAGRDPQPDLGQVRRVERGMIRRAARGEHDVPWPPGRDSGSDPRDRLRVRAGEEPGEHLRLLGDVRRHARAALRHRRPPRSHRAHYPRIVCAVLHIQAPFRSSSEQ